MLEAYKALLAKVQSNGDEINAEDDGRVVDMTANLSARYRDTPATLFSSALLKHGNSLLLNSLRVAGAGAPSPSLPKIACNVG